MALQSFFNTRATMKQIGVNDVREGWVSPQSDGLLILDVESPFTIPYMAMVNIELKTLKYSTEFASEFISCEGNQCVLTLPPAIPRRPGREDARYRGILSKIKCIADGQNTEFRVTDVAVNGIGIVTNEVMEVGSILPLQANLPAGVVEFEWQCLYARQVQPNNPNLWQAGGKILSIGRTDMVRWRSFLLDRA